MFTIKLQNQDFKVVKLQHFLLTKRFRFSFSQVSIPGQASPPSVKFLGCPTCNSDQPNSTVYKAGWLIFRAVHKIGSQILVQFFSSSSSSCHPSIIFSELKTPWQINVPIGSKQCQQYQHNFLIHINFKVHIEQIKSVSLLGRGPIFFWEQL